MKTSIYVGAIIGIAILIGIAVHADLPDMIRVLRLGGWPLLWVMPYRASFFLLYALGWMALLRPNAAARRIGLGYFFWATAVRDSIDRLLPVASVGGSFVGVRVLGWRGVALPPAAASVVVEIFLTVVAVYSFTAAGLLLLAKYAAQGHEFRRLMAAFALGLPVPAIVLVLLRNGALLRRLKNVVHSIAGENAFSRGTEALDREIRASLRRKRELLAAGALQLAALISGSFEIWFALRLFQHPVGVGTAVALESMTQAVRHIAFAVPSGIGVQEAGLIAFGHLVGIDADTALAVAMIKRLRELVWGVPFLLSWQWIEGTRLRTSERPAERPID